MCRGAIQTQRLLSCFVLRGSRVTRDLAGNQVNMYDMPEEHSAAAVGQPPNLKPLGTELFTSACRAQLLYPFSLKVALKNSSIPEDSHSLLQLWHSVPGWKERSAC